MAILFINGINDRSVIGVKLDRNSRLVQLIDGNTSIHRRLPLKPGIDHEFMLFGKGVQQHAVQFQVQPSLIFNQIADADTHRGALDRCIELCRQVDSKVINRPEKVLQTTRDQVSARLQGIPGLVMPRILRFRPQSPEAVLEFALENRILHPYSCAWRAVIMGAIWCASIAPATCRPCTPCRSMDAIITCHSSSTTGQKTACTISCASS